MQKSLIITLYCIFFLYFYSCQCTSMSRILQQQQQQENNQQDQWNVVESQQDDQQQQQQEQQTQQEQPQQQQYFSPIDQFSLQDEKLERSKGYLQQIDKSQKFDNSDNDVSYDQFVDKYRNKDIRWKDPEIMFYKAKVLSENIQRIKVHNNQSGISYFLGINQYADMTVEEFRNRYMSNNPIDPVVSVKSEEKIKLDILSNTHFSIDWQCHDSVAFSQGECRAQYAMAVIKTIQLTMKIHNFQFEPLSVQEIISCMERNDEDENKGCNGDGAVEAVYEYAKTKGIGPAKLYPYGKKAQNLGQVESCKKIQHPKYASAKKFIGDYGRVTKGDCAELVYRLRFRALTVSIDSTQLSFYKNGIINMKKPLSQLKLNHAVTLVGYDPDTQYFKIKNSWGSNWGMRGYALVTKNIGVCQQAMYPMLKVETTLPGLC